MTNDDIKHANRDRDEHVRYINNEDRCSAPSFFNRTAHKEGRVKKRTPKRIGNKKQETITNNELNESVS